MNATISKWGNSLALRLPKPLADGANLTVGTEVVLELEDGVLKVTPVKGRLGLQALLEGEPKPASRAEEDWGEPEGVETW